MSIQHNTAENFIDAGKERDREWSSSAIVTRNSTRAEAWLNGNREAVERNTFFPLAIETDSIARATRDLHRHRWMHRHPITH